MPKGADIFALTSIKEDSVRNGALEMSALILLSGQSAASEIINLPNLHAKVFIAGQHRAIITSANLTQSGIDKNYEYGIEIIGKKCTAEVRKNILDYAAIGTKVDIEEIDRISKYAKAVENIEKTRKTPEEKKLRQEIRNLQDKCLELQIGDKTPTGLFSDAIYYVLRGCSMKTDAIQEHIRGLYPQLCEEERERIIKGVGYGKLWKHHLRNAQQQMKRQGKIFYDSKSRMWSMSSTQAK